ncbi:MAG: hypothetical protein ACKO6I_06725 [Sphingomonadales bacterium]
MRQVLNIVLFLTGIFMSTSGCRKFSSRDLYSLDANFKSIFSFPEGSTWTYYLSTDTNQRETVILKNKQEGKMRFDNLEQEFISYELHSTRDSQQLVRCMATGENTARFALLHKDTFFRQVAEMYYSSSLFSGIMGNGDTVNYLPTLSVGDVMYFNVIELKSSRKKIYSRLYFSSNTGIVRKDYVDGSTYLLKSFR